MDTADYEAALALVRSTSVDIHDIGTAIYLSPDVFGWAAEWGYGNPFAFYFAGRGGMLGDVTAVHLGVGSDTLVYHNRAYGRVARMDGQG